MILFEGPGVTYVRPELLISLTWRGLIVFRHGRVTFRACWLPRDDWN